MRSATRALGGALFGLLILYGIARGSLAEYAPDSLAGYSTGRMTEEPAGAVAPGETALLRLSWRTRGESVHACRRLSSDEVEAMPMHMRREEVCERRILPWRLHLELDGVPVLNDTILPAGARQDRPLYVYRDLPLRPGRYGVAVRFEQVLPERQSADPDDDDDDDDDDDRRPGPSATPPALSYGAEIDIGPGEIMLVTYDPDTRSLVMRGPPRRGSVEAEEVDEQPERSR